MAIDNANLTLVRMEYGDTDGAVFTDDEIGDLWDVMSNAPDDYTRRRATVGQLFVITRNNAAKLRDYSQGASSESQSQVFAHLQAVISEYQSDIHAGLGHERQMSMTTLRVKPHQDRILPNTDHRLDTIYPKSRRYRR